MANLPGGLTFICLFDLYIFFLFFSFFILPKLDGSVLVDPARFLQTRREMAQNLVLRLN